MEVVCYSNGPHAACFMLFSYLAYSLTLKMEATCSSNALHIACFMLVSCLTYFLTLKLEVMHSSKMLVDFHQTTQHYIPKVGTLHSHYCKNLKSNQNLVL
jgi:hypothetical protein